MKFKKFFKKFWFIVLIGLVLSVNLSAKADIYSYDPEKEFYTRVAMVFDGIDDNSYLRPEYIGALYYISSTHSNITYEDFTDDVIKEIFSYMQRYESTYTIQEDDAGNMTLLEGEVNSDEEETDSEESNSNEDTETSDETSSKENRVEFPKYNLTDTQIKHLAAVCKREQGTLEGAAAEASLMANLYEYKGSDYSSIYSYVKNSGWFGNVSKFNNTIKKNPGKKYIAVVKNVLVNGKRTLPRYVDEHDCWDCNFKAKYRCSDGKAGDICKLNTNGKIYTSMKQIKNRKNYKSDITKIYSVYGKGKEYYTFYTFPTDSSDPFGYTQDAYEKYKKYGDGHYNFNGSYTVGSSNNERLSEATASSTFKAKIDLIYFKDQLIQNWFSRPEFGEISDDLKERMAIETISHVEEYKLLMGIGGEEETSGDGTCSYKVGNKTYTDPTIELLYCDGSGVIKNEPTVDFEKYILGVTRVENGNGETESFKAQAVATRSYTLQRPSSMNGAFGVKYTQINGHDAINIRSCTNDQAYCDPEEGCWTKSSGGGQTNVSNPGDYYSHTMYSGSDSSQGWSLGPLSNESEIRQAVLDTKGQVAVNNKGEVVLTPYINTDQNAWNAMAKQGKDYYEIIKKHYASKGVVNIASNCSSSGNAEAESWKQADPRWGGKYISSNTLANVGCMITSTAIQIARSGTKLTVSNFDPGVFLDTIKAHNGVSGNDFRVDDNSWATVAPNFKVGGVVYFYGSAESKIEKMKQYTTGNKYLIIQLWHPGQHWVAVTAIENGKIKMADPASETTDFASKYSISTVSKGYYFEKKD